jgi:hypothetical protein
MLGCQLRFITVVYHATMYTGIPFLLINFKYTSLGTFFEIESSLKLILQWPTYPAIKGSCQD